MTPKLRRIQPQSLKLRVPSSIAPYALSICVPRQGRALSGELRLDVLGQDFNVMTFNLHPRRQTVDEMCVTIE